MDRRGKVMVVGLSEAWDGPAALGEQSEGSNPQTPPAEAAFDPAPRAPREDAKPACRSGQSNVQDAQEPAAVPRLLLFPPGVPKHLPAPKQRFKNVVVFGAHHTCTNALMRELPRFFDVTVRNKHRVDNPRQPDIDHRPCLGELLNFG